MTPADDSDAIVVRRTIPAARERVFDAWLDPARLATFMRPGDVTHVTANVDARVGGTFRIVMEHGRGDAEHTGEYLTIDRPRLLAFTWKSGSTDWQPSIVTIELIELGAAQTEVVLTHRGIPPRTIEPHRGGWGRILELLAASPAT
ncbi:MAG: SRPBCC domain-containing protein [Gemmatimonadaceae bacterium]